MAPKPQPQPSNRFRGLEDFSLSDPPDPPERPNKRHKSSSIIFSEYPELPKKTNSKNPRFVLISSNNSEKPLTSISVFVLKKTIDSISTEYEKISQLKDGSILILTKNQQIADKFINSNALNKLCPVTIKLHPNLNLTKGVAYAPFLINIPETEIVSEMKCQKVTDVYKFTKVYDGKRRPTGLMLFSFDLFQLPDFIEVGWYKTKVTEYIPNPMRCRQCQLLGHTIKWCKKSPSCVNCNLPPHENLECTRTMCANCQGPHPASSTTCPRYIQNKDILTIKTKTKSSLAEARRIYKERNPLQIVPNSNLYSTKLKENTNMTARNSKTSTSVSQPSPIPPNTEKTIINLQNTKTTIAIPPNSTKNHSLNNKNSINTNIQSIPTNESNYSKSGIRSYSSPINSLFDNLPTTSHTDQNSYPIIHSLLNSSEPEDCGCDHDGDV